eukprot:7917163-Pyramimonas_sp.AAC.1
MWLCEVEDPVPLARPPDGPGPPFSPGGPGRPCALSGCAAPALETPAGPPGTGLRGPQEIDYTQERPW